MKERLEELLQLLHLTPTQFANSIGVQRGTLQHVLSGRNEPSLKIIMAIHNSFPDVGLEWLLYGKGEAIPGLQQQKTDSELEYPLLPGMDALFHDDVRKTPDFLNLREEETRSIQRKKRNNKDVTSSIEDNKTTSNKNIKEVVVFFDDGTYQKFSSELKK